MKKAAPAKNRREKPAINRFGCSASDYTRSGASRAQADHLCWHHPVFADGFARIDAEIRPGGSKAASGSNAVAATHRSKDALKRRAARAGPRDGSPAGPLGDELQGPRRRDRARRGGAGAPLREQRRPAGDDQVQARA